jgi:LemA protein
MVILAAVGVVLLGWLALTFNRFIRLRQLMREAWSGIEVQLKRRHDLVPQLVDAVKGYRDYEQRLLEHITELRARCPTIQQVKPRGEAETELSRDLRSFLAIAEAYPDLKANEQFLNLQRTLAATEDDIQLARRYYNGTVRDFNIQVESFPSLLVAQAWGFPLADYFELESATEGSVPTVQL